MPKEAANVSSFGLIKVELEVLKVSFAVKGDEILKGSFDREEIEFLN